MLKTLQPLDTTQVSLESHKDVIYYIKQKDRHQAIKGLVRCNKCRDSEKSLLLTQQVEQRNLTSNHCVLNNRFLV